MASRRKLKKTIQFVSSELVTDVYFRCLMSKNIEESKVDKIVIDITETSREFILRVNRPTGKNNPVLVKSYYRSLYSSWQTAMEKILKDIASL
jgi:hypothetical protein